MNLYIPLEWFIGLPIVAGKEPLVLIEAQTGTYLGEDDIIRLEDTYNRSN
ncbi:MAG: hypothetical protein R3D35_14050 [Nitratireductor sp.]